MYSTSFSFGFSNAFFNVIASGFVPAPASADSLDSGLSAVSLLSAASQLISKWTLSTPSSSSESLLSLASVILLLAMALEKARCSSIVD